MTVDPRAEDYYSYSQYNYVGGNPIKRVDVNGEFWNYVFGAVAGAVVDYCGQVASNMVSGKSFTEALTHDISVGSILVSAGEGALTSGASVFKTAAKSTAKAGAKTMLKQGAKTVIKEGSKGATGQIIDNSISILQGENKSIFDNVLDKTVTSVIVGPVVNAKGFKKTDVNALEKSVKKLSKKTNPTSGQVNLLKSNKKSLLSSKVGNSVKQVGNGAISNSLGKLKTNIEDKLNNKE